MSDEILRVNIMYQYGGLLYVVDPDKNYVFSIIDIAKDKMVSRFGKIGEGPCELNRISSVLRVPGAPNKIGVYCMQKFSYFEFGLDQVLKKSNDKEAECELQLKNFDPNFMRVINIGNNRFLGVGFFDKKYALTSPGTTMPKFYYMDYHFQNEFQSEYANESLAMASQGDLVLKPDGSKVFFGAHNFMGFDIFKLKEDSLILEKRAELTTPKFKKRGEGNILSVDFSSDNMYGYQKSVASDQFIYALYSGKNKNEEYRLCKWVYVYDWNGNFIKRIELDREVSSITVSENDSYLIGTVDDGKANLYRFDL
ncbi:BF3164 family lipoprotein [Echinicola salinicaeni]|uniref:BF3164 family lipoprotein n=1 Tax=Echinicola salinicaeni TaxID=2762757 RepID=UPI001648FE27|nr:BF3164 family lipoprotein [Echinicola salinicaeni]